ncbi:MAG: helix-turn-helix transcriptional regulator [Bradyrhizobium sp.]
MTSQSKQIAMSANERDDYGFARVRDAAYDGVMDLWRRRKDQGMTQAQLADALGGDAGWLSRNLRGPGNWTLRTVGRFVQALNGEVEFKVHGLEDPLPVRSNYHAYVGYEPEMTATAGPTVRQRGCVTSSVSGPVILKGPVKINTTVVVP